VQSCSEFGFVQPSGIVGVPGDERFASQGLKLFTREAAIVIGIAVVQKEGSQKHCRAKTTRTFARSAWGCATPPGRTSEGPWTSRSAEGTSASFRFHFRPLIGSEFEVNVPYIGKLI